MEKVFGIDLGTTYSCIAHIDEFGKPVIIENAENERTTPSVVFFEEGNESVIVGNTAKNALETDPEKVVSFIKRFMGNPNYPGFEHDDKTYTPESISALILKKLAKDAGEKLGTEVKKVVITCPAYFGNNEREATKNAGIIAGLDVLAIINEPTAAAISYGIENEGNQTVLVYDLGGGTFDVTIIKVSEGKIEVVATGGDHELGGKNWDEIIMMHFESKFKEQAGVEADLFSDVETAGDLQLKSENTKKDLTNRDKVTAKVIHEGDKENITVTTEDFENLTESLVAQTIQLTNATIESAKNKEGGIDQIDKILMVGGSTKMPMIKAALEENYPNLPIESHKPDEAVALGAALYAQNIEHYNSLIQLAKEQGVDVNNLEDVKEAVKSGELDTSNLKFSLPDGGVDNLTEIINVVSRSYGVGALNRTQEKKIFNLIKKDTALPIDVTQQFGTQYKDQTVVAIELYENEKSEQEVEIEEGLKLVDGNIEGITPDLPQGSPIEVSFKLNEQGLLEVLAKEESSGKVLRLEYQSDAVLSDEQVDEAAELVGSIAVS